MTEPLSIFTAPPRSEQTAAISADLLAAYVRMERAVECQLCNHSDDTGGILATAYERVRELSGMHCEAENV